MVSWVVGRWVPQEVVRRIVGAGAEVAVPMIVGVAEEEVDPMIVDAVVVPTTVGAA